MNTADELRDALESAAQLPGTDLGILADRLAAHLADRGLTIAGMLSASTIDPGPMVEALGDWQVDRLRQALAERDGRPASAGTLERLLDHRDEMREVGEPERLRSWAEFRDSGLLWLLNSTALHPRGFAVAFDSPIDGGDIISIGDPTGWRLLGNGTEPWVFADTDDTPPGETLADKFAAVEALLDEARRADPLRSVVDDTGAARLPILEPPPAPGEPLGTVVLAGNGRASLELVAGDVDNLTPAGRVVKLAGVMPERVLERLDAVLVHVQDDLSHDNVNLAGVVLHPDGTANLTLERITPVEGAADRFTVQHRHVDIGNVVGEPYAAATPWDFTADVTAAPVDVDGLEVTVNDDRGDK